MQPDSIQAVPALALQRIDDIDPPPSGEMRRRRSLVERDRFRARRPVTQLHAKVATIRAERLGPHHLDLLAEEQRLAIADSEGGEQLNFMMEAWFEVGEGRGRLDGDRPGEGIAIQAGRRVLLEAFLQLGKAALQHREPRRHRVPTESMQQRRALLKAIYQVKALDAPRR